VQVLVLHRRDYDALVRSGVIGAQVQSAVMSVGTARRNENRNNFDASRTLGAIRGQKAGGGGGGGGGGMSKEKLTATSIRAWNSKTAAVSSGEAKDDVLKAVQGTLHVEGGGANSETRSGRHDHNESDQSNPDRGDVNLGPE
jgi:hypothetical protein